MSDPLPLKSLNHIAVATSRVRESRAFYCGVLGLREFDRPKFNFDGAWLAGHGMVIHLVHNPDAGAGDHQLRSRVEHIALHTGDLETVKRRLAEHDIAYRCGQLADTRIEQIYFLDPDGNQIEVASYPAHMMPDACQPQ